MSERERFLRFLLVGGTSAVLTAGARSALGTAMSYRTAVAVSCVIGMTIAFALNRLLVFAPGMAPMRTQYLRFVLVNLVGFPQTWAMSVGLAEAAFPAIGVTWHAEFLAHLIGMATPIGTSYFGHKHFSFGRPAAAEGPAAKGPAGCGEFAETRQQPA